MEWRRRLIGLGLEAPKQRAVTRVASTCAARVHAPGRRAVAGARLAAGSSRWPGASGRARTLNAENGGRGSGSRLGQRQATEAVCQRASSELAAPRARRLWSSKCSVSSARTPPGCHAPARTASVAEAPWSRRARQLCVARRPSSSSSRPSALEQQSNCRNVRHERMLPPQRRFGVVLKCSILGHSRRPGSGCVEATLQE